MRGRTLPAARASSPTGRRVASTPLCPLWPSACECDTATLRTCMCTSRWSLDLHVHQQVTISNAYVLGSHVAGHNASTLRDAARAKMFSSVHLVMQVHVCAGASIRRTCGGWYTGTRLPALTASTRSLAGPYIRHMLDPVGARRSVMTVYSTFTPADNQPAHFP